MQEADYLHAFRQAVVGEHDPETVILMEIDPEKQKTAVDFYCTERFTGVQAVNITAIHKRGHRLFYHRNGREIPVHRIYNRVIVDEFLKKGIQCEFDFRDELEVEWAGHPNWYFRMSKFSLPFLRHRTVPRATFLHQLECYPEDLHNFVLKPLFSFAGSGVIIDVTRAALDAIPAPERPNFACRKKSNTASHSPPSRPAGRDSRVVFWTDQLRAVSTLARLSRARCWGGL
jgi:uncharacterized protein (UPF0248 family)